MGALKNTLNFLAWGALGALIVTAVSAGIKFDWGTFTTPHEEITEEEDKTSEVEISENGIKLKLLSTETRANGDQVQTFTYTIDSGDLVGVDETVKVKSYYQDDKSDASAVISASVDVGSKTVTVTNVGGTAFNKVIVVEVYAVNDESINATVTCQYAKRLLDLNLGTLNYTSGDNVNLIQKILDNSNTNEASIYTLDVDYTTAEYLSAFKFKNVTNISVYAGDQTVGTGSWEDYLGWDTVESIISEMQNLFDEKLSDYQAENFELLNQTLPTASELWNLSTNNTWHDFLKNYIGNQVGVRFDITGATLETPYGTTTASDENNSIMITYDFSDFSLTPVGISVDTPNLIF